MAGLRDSNGRIVIDEAEAEAEAKRILQAKAKLEEARSILDSLKNRRRTHARRNS